MSIDGATRHFVDLGHTNLSYQKLGAGPDVVFIHGWPLNGDTWRNVVPHLDGFTRWVIDLPGTGHSKATDASPYTVRAYADAVVAFIDALGFDDVVLVAQDSGGMMARFAAEQRPQVVSALSLAGTEIPGVHAPLVTLFKFLAKLPGGKSMFKLTMSNRFLARTPLILGGTVFDRSLLDGDLRTKLLDPILADDDALKWVVKMIKHFSFADIDVLADVHPNLTMPVLLAYGEDDGFFPVEKARAMADQFGGPTEFVSIPNCKLLLHEEHPQRFAELTSTFLENHNVRSS